MNEDYSGSVLDDRYRVISLIGKGGTAAVYLGQKIDTGTQVAVKFLNTSLSEDETAIKRFFREARAAVEISHENIIRVLDVGLGTWDEPYLVMEYLDGESLSEMMERIGPMDLAVTCEILESVLSGLNAIHQKGIVHRDIRPEKIYLVHRRKKKPVVKLTDFGLSKFAQKDEKSNLTSAGIMLGRLSYISPEQVRSSKKADERSDLYSVGTIMYEMLTGKLPFYHVPTEGKLVAKLAEEPKAPREAFSRFPIEAEPLVMRILSRDPSARPQSAAEMLSELRKLHTTCKSQSRMSKIRLGMSRIIGARQSGDLQDAGDAPVSATSAPERDESVVSGVKKTWQTLTGSLYGKIACGIVAAGIVAGVVGLLAAPDSEERQSEVSLAGPNQNSASAVAEEPSAKPEDVQIEVRGLPIGAKIYFADAPVPVNPFRVELKEVIVPLRIEADGYETYSTSLVPSEDQVVKVEMKRLDAVSESFQTDEDAEPTEDGQTESPEQIEQAGPSKKRNGDERQGHRPRAKVKKMDQDGFRKGRRGTRFGEEFE